MSLIDQIFRKNLSDSMLNTCIESAEYLLEFPALEIFLQNAPARNPRNAIKFEAMLLTYGIILNQMYQRLNSRKLNEFQNEIWLKFRNYAEKNKLSEGLQGNFIDFCTSRFELNHNQIDKYLQSQVGTFIPRKILYNIFQCPLSQSIGECNNIEIEKYFANRFFGVLDIIMKGINKSL
jgi:hypothetical protein